jgi:hypothetical protein
MMYLNKRIPADRAPKVSFLSESSAHWLGNIPLRTEVLKDINPSIVLKRVIFFVVRVAVSFWAFMLVVAQS